MDLKEVDSFEGGAEKHWYYIAKASATLNLVKQYSIGHILDVGAGTGYFSRYLLEHSTATFATCVDIAYPNDNEDVFHSKKIYYKKKQPSQIDAQLVLLMDVLEHIKDDKSFLTSYVDSVDSGTMFFISVPAFQFLWSEHDIFLEHERRYTLKQINSLVQNCNLEVEQCCYYFASIFPIVASIRLAKKLFKKNIKDATSDMKKNTKVVNSLLSAVCKLETSIMRYNKIAGLSAFVLARKK